jgi:hypothetical protein
MTTHAQFVDAVADMRRLQRAWFGGDKSDATLEAAKKAEREVDKMLRGMKDAERQPSLAFDEGNDQP